nr:MAG TPA: hypothetical protein [Caudoviricetes sp.]
MADLECLFLYVYSTTCGRFVNCFYRKRLEVNALWFRLLPI